MTVLSACVLNVARDTQETRPSKTLASITWQDDKLIDIGVSHPRMSGAVSPPPTGYWGISLKREEMPTIVIEQVLLLRSYIRWMMRENLFSHLADDVYVTLLVTRLEVLDAKLSAFLTSRLHLRKYVRFTHMSAYAATDTEDVTVVACRTERSIV